MFSRVMGAGILLAALLTPISASARQPKPNHTAHFTPAAAFDVSPSLHSLAGTTTRARVRPPEDFPERGPTVPDSGHSPDSVLQNLSGTQSALTPLANFEGLSNQDNFDVFGFRVNPPDTIGDIGPNHYVQMVNIVIGVFSRTGERLLAPVDIGALWSGFAIDECTDPSGDPVVFYDQFADRWLLTQFTTRGLTYPNEPLNLFYNCVAISTTGDPTGSYYRYAFSTGYNFPDYPKYGVWRDSYLVTTREFGVLDPEIYGVGVYGLERHKMIEGDPTARAAGFLLERHEVPINLFGDGLLPADVDGNHKPRNSAKAPIIGTQDDDGPYGVTFDAVNVWEFDVKWRSTPTASIELATQLPVAEFDSVFPCGPVSPRDCLPQPGITDRAQFIDHLGYRQRPTWRLAYRTLGPLESMVTNQSVEAAPGHAGLRWYEILRIGDHYRVHQQGTYAPNDGIHRWMGSIAMDKFGNMALGYSVVNATDVYPGIRYTGRRIFDPPGVMALTERTIIDGSGVQTSAGSRWGDYTAMNIDPTDDCTFWYTNEYYTAAGQASSPAGWQTRIASFRLPFC